MSTVSVFVAPVSQRPLLSALLDLSAQDALGEEGFGWIEAPPDPSCAPDKQDPTVIWAAKGGMEVTTYAARAHQEDVTLVRVIVLVPLGINPNDRLSKEAEGFYLDNLTAPGAASLVYKRVFVPWSLEDAESVVGWQGRYNVMLSPGDSASPDTAGVPWWNRSPDDTCDVPGLAACGLAIEAGIVRGINNAPHDPHDGDIPHNSKAIRIVKPYVRIVEVEGVENELRQSVFKMNDGYPTPYGNQDIPLTGFQNPEEQCSDVADQWASLHKSTLIREPGDGDPPSKVSIGAWEALKMYVQFLWAAVRGAPREWLKSATSAVKKTTAGVVEGFVFGDDPDIKSKFKVLVGGVDKEGLPFGWKVIYTGATLPPEVKAKVKEKMREIRARDTAFLWSDLLGGGRGLLDGSGWEPLNLKPDEGYVKDSSFVALPRKDGEGTFTFTLPRRETIGLEPLQSWDALGIARAKQQLVEEGKAQISPRNKAAAAEQLRELEEWERDTRDHYLPRIGNHLKDWFEEAYQRVGEVLCQFEELRKKEEAQELSPVKENKLVRTVQTITLVAILAILTVILLALFSVIGWATAGCWVGGAISWLIALLAVTLKDAQILFRILHRSREEDTRRSDLERRLAESLSDLEAVGFAYQQFVQWATIFTAFVSDPLGHEESDETEERSPVPAPATPDNMKIVRAESSEEHLKETAALLRRNIFRVGWTGEAWGDFEKKSMKKYPTAEQRMNWEHGHLSITAEPGTPGSPLVRWGDGVEENGAESPYEHDRWEDCLKSLRSDSSLLARLHLTKQPGGQPIEEILAPLRKPHQGEVVAGVLTASAQNDGKQTVDPGQAWRDEAPEGLGTTVVLLQSTDALSAKDFIYRKPLQEERRVIIEEDTFEWA